LEFRMWLRFADDCCACQVLRGHCVAEAAHAGRVPAAAAADERVHEAARPEPQQLQPVRRVQPLRHHGRRTLHHLQLQQGIQKVGSAHDSKKLSEIQNGGHQINFSQGGVAFRRSDAIYDYASGDFNHFGLGHIKVFLQKLKSKMAAMRLKCHAPWSFFRQFSSDFRPVFDVHSTSPH
jgi:hypothetical protein